ncbi:hypothetical protein DFJ73DRAFT_813400 [Zopfochytrium polystomum]|nr:hypothetical protein DFJ73DRAFT_813400 [Zopfochytrium polystomum]
MAIYAIVKAGSGGGGGGDVPQTTSQVAPVDPTTQRAVTSTTQNPPAQTSSQDPGSLPVAGGPPTTSQNDQTDSAGSVPSTGMAGSRTGDSSSVPASTAKDSRSQSLTATSQKGGSVVGSPTAPAGTGTTSGPNQSANTPGSINTDGGGSGVNTTAIVAGTVAAFLFLLLLSCCVVVATRGRNKEEQSPFESGGRMRSNSGAPLLLIEKADSAEDSHATFTMQNADSYANYSLGYGGFYGKSELLIPGELYGESTERGVMMLSSTRTPTPPAAVLSAGYGISASAAAASLRRGEDPFQTYASLSMIRSRSGSMRSQSSQSSIGPDGTLLLSAEAEAAYTLARPIPSTAEAVMHRKSLAYTVRKTEPASYDDDDSEAARVQPVS